MNKRCDCEHHAPPDLEVGVLHDLDRFVLLIGRAKPRPAVYKAEALNRKLVIEPGDHDMAVSDRLGAVNHDHVAVSEMALGELG